MAERERVTCFMFVIGPVSRQGLHQLTHTSKNPSPSSLHATRQDLHKRPPPPGPCGPQRAENETGPAAPAAVSSHNQSRSSQTPGIIRGLATSYRTRTRMHQPPSPLCCQALRSVLRLLRDRRHPPSPRRCLQPVKIFTNTRRRPLYLSGSCGP